MVPYYGRICCCLVATHMEINLILLNKWLNNKMSIMGRKSESWDKKSRVRRQQKRHSEKYKAAHNNSLLQLSFLPLD
jgi:hypothetical protein